MVKFPHSLFSLTISMLGLTFTNLHHTSGILLTGHGPLNLTLHPRT
jgi:hypothetical protein